MRTTINANNIKKGSKVMKVGIDLSSTNTGLVILSDDNKLIFHGNFQLWDNNRFTIACNVSDMIDVIKFKNINNELISIGVELADFKNANITNRFNLLAGMIISELWHSNLPLMTEDFKLFNSNEWQRFLLEKFRGWILPQTIIIKGKKVIKYRIVNLCQAWYRHKINTNLLDKRQLLKELSRLWSDYSLLEYTENWTEDECDAYCIAYFLPLLRDRTQMHQEVKVRNKNKAKSEKQALRDKLSKEKRVNKLKDIVIKYKSMSKLTKAQQRALEKANKELEELEHEN